MKNIIWLLENKMENPTFIDEEDIPMVNKDEADDYDYRTPNTNRMDDTSFTVDTTEATSTQLRQKVKQDKLSALYRHLNVTANPGLAEIDQFMIKKKNQKQVTLTCFFSMVITSGNPLLINEPVSF